MKKNKLYVANKWNQPAFMVGLDDADDSQLIFPKEKKEEPTEKKKDNKLHTVNKFNRAAFTGRSENLFAGPQPGSNQMQQTSTIAPVMAPRINWGSSTQRAAAMGQMNAVTSSFASGKPIDMQTSNGLTGKALQGLNTMNLQNSMASAYQMGAQSGSGMFQGKNGAMAQAGMAAGMAMMDNIQTGDKRGMWDTLDPVYHLAGGRESGAGNAMSDAGVSLTKAGLQSGQPYMALAGAALKVVGGLTNAAFGIKTDQRRLNAINEGIDTYNNFKSNASSFDDIQGVTASESGNVYEGGWFSGGSAARKNEEINRRLMAARSFADRSVSNNISNIIDDQLSNALANYSAFGGRLLTNKKKRRR